eukprot:PhF_6_TR26313/c0_g1_i1/m.37799
MSSPTLPLEWGPMPSNPHFSNLWWTTNDVLSFNPKNPQIITITLNSFDFTSENDIIIALSPSRPTWNYTKRYDDTLTFAIRRQFRRIGHWMEDWTAAIRTSMYGNYEAYTNHNFWQRNTNLKAEIVLDTELKTAQLVLSNAATKRTLTADPPKLDLFFEACAGQPAVYFGYNCTNVELTPMDATLGLQVHRVSKNWLRRKCFYLCARLFHAGRAKRGTDDGSKNNDIIIGVLESALPFDVVNEIVLFL